MENFAKLSEAEFSEMITLIKRYVDQDMNQWELWKFDSKFGKAYISLSLKPLEGQSESYSDLSHLSNRE